MLAVAVLVVVNMSVFMVLSSWFVGG